MLVVFTGLFNDLMIMMWGVLHVIYGFVRWCCGSYLVVCFGLQFVVNLKGGYCIITLLVICLFLDWLFGGLFWVCVCCFCVCIVLLWFDCLFSFVWLCILSVLGLSWLLVFVGFWFVSLRFGISLLAGWVGGLLVVVFWLVTDCYSGYFLFYDLRLVV